MGTPGRAFRRWQSRTAGAVSTVQTTAMATIPEKLGTPISPASCNAAKAA